MKIKIFFLILFSVLSVTSSIAQRKSKKLTITGLVTDANQNPVSGAMILVDNKSTNTVTNNKGYYKISIRRDTGLITAFTFDRGVGEAALLNGQTTINITLIGTTSSQNYIQDNNEDDKLVNAGYGSVDPKNLPLYVNSLDVSNDKYASYTNIYEVLRGTIPGVEVNGKSIRIQGASSFMLSTEPLFVVDGIVVSSIDDISPSLIRSIEVLKGSAASIYGSRSSSGVILIQLKGSSD